MSKPSHLNFYKVSFWIHFFDLHLECMNRLMAIRLGNVIGCFEDVHYNEEEYCWGSSLRVRVSLDISKPLRRGVKLNIAGPMGGSWIPLQYEGLPDCCFHCGKLDHLLKDCEDNFSEGSFSMRKHQYGPWLRYQGPLKPLNGPPPRKSPAGQGESTRSNSDQATSESLPTATQPCRHNDSLPHPVMAEPPPEPQLPENQGPPSVTNQGILNSGPGFNGELKLPSPSVTILAVSPNDFVPN